MTYSHYTLCGTACSSTGVLKKATEKVVVAKTYKNSVPFYTKTG